MHIHTNIHTHTHTHMRKPLTTRIYVWVVKLLVGPNGDSPWSRNYKCDDRHREQSQKAGVFRKIWPDTPVYLDPEIENMLSEMDERSIMKAPRPWCLRWWRTCGKKVPRCVTVRQLRSQILDWRSKLQQTGERIIIGRGNTHIPHTTTQHTQHHNTHNTT